MPNQIIKRSLDVILTLVGLVLFAIPMLFLVIAVRLSLGSPVFFVQSRPGRFGLPFDMYKFRTMTDDRDNRGKLKPDGERLTPFGKWLRASSLDELPEFWNVLRGEMSLVGPRPLLLSYLPLYSSLQARRHEVRPGITGWAQVNGRNALSWEKKFELDVWYVDNQSLWLDIRILVLSVSKVMQRDGINAKDDATMPPFTGSK